MLKEMFDSYNAVAKTLPNYKTLTIDELADGYCDADDENDKEMSDKYFAALVLRFWYRIKQLAHNNQSTKMMEDEFIDWVVDGILYACKYRGWRKGEVSAQSCINRSIDTKRQTFYQVNNYDNRKANFATESFDGNYTEEEGDEDLDFTIANTSLNNIEDGSNFESDVAVRSIIQSYINRNKLIEAIIIDNIAYNDVQRWDSRVVKDEDGSHVEVTSEFWARQLVKLLNNLPESYSNYFQTTYKVNNSALSSALNRIKEGRSGFFYKSIQSTLDSLKVEMGV